MASAPCRDCDRGSYRCDGCHRIFCEYHSSEHQQELGHQFQDLTSKYSNLKETLALPPSYESLTESTELLNKIEQWENDTIRQIKEISEQMKEKIRRRSDTIVTERFTPEFQQLTEHIQRIQRTNHFLENDIEQLTTELNDLKIQVENSFLTTADIRIIPIDWTKYIQIILKQQKIQQNQREIHFDRLITTRSRISLDVRGAEWHILGAASTLNSTFLHYQHSNKNKRLTIMDYTGQEKPISWVENQSIWDCCWSTFLNKFIVLADNRVYTYSDDNGTNSTINSLELIQTIKPKRDQMEFLRCTCSDEKLFITYDERNSSIDEYNMNQWIIQHQYENLIKKNEIIISISCSEINSNLIGMTILDDKHYWYFQLRDRSMLLISSIQLDKSEFNRRVISLPNSNMNWLIIHTGSKFFTIFNENVQIKKMIECTEVIDLATFIPDKNCLVVLTQKNKLKFFDL